MRSLKDLPINPNCPTKSQIFLTPLKGFPNPGDRSRNDPAYILSSGAVLRLVAQYRTDIASKDNLCLQDYEDLRNYALGVGWANAWVVGKQLILVADYQDWLAHL